MYIRRGLLRSLLILLICAAQAQAAILRIDKDGFLPGSGSIIFSEFPVGAVNPVYTPDDYVGEVGATVRFDGFFLGQSLGDETDCPGAVPQGCVIGEPVAPLRLDGAAPDTSIITDGMNPTAPVLAGSPQFNGPVAILFDVDMAAVGLDGGFLDALRGTAVRAYARDGSEIGRIGNAEKNIAFLGLATLDGSERIAGLLLSLVGNEPAGFGIDNIHFGLADQIRLPELTLSVTGDCPGLTLIKVTGAAVPGSVALFTADETGLSEIPAGPCAGTELGLSDASLLLVAPTDFNGELRRTRDSSPSDCGDALQAVDAVSCATSNIDQFPDSSRR